MGGRPTDIYSGLTAERARELLSYDPETGDLRWRRSWRRAKAGAMAGFVHAKGYRLLALDEHRYWAHRVIWLYMTGHWPADQIDHINRCRSDNRWINLREATGGQNKANKRRSSKNTSGFKGVDFVPAMRKPWRARVKVNGVTNYLGYFPSPEEAHQAYVSGSRRAFGEFAHAG